MTTPIIRRLVITVWAAILMLLVAGCPRYAPERPDVAEPLLEITTDSDLPLFADDMDYDGLETAIGHSLTYLSRVPEDRRYRFGSTEYSRDQMVFSLVRFRDYIATRPHQEQLNQFIRKHYRIYRSIGRPPDADVLFTGYFEPLYPGRRTYAPTYPVPVYGIPNDLVTANLGDFLPEWAGKRLVGRVDKGRLVPYFTRKEILDGGALAQKAPIIAWMKDPVDLYFIQVQYGQPDHMPGL